MFTSQPAAPSRPSLGTVPLKRLFDLPVDTGPLPRSAARLGRSLWLLLLAFGLTLGSSSLGIAGAPGGESVLYEISLARHQTQMVTISMHLPSLGRSELEVHLPTWRPGRYEILDPVGTLRSFAVHDGSPDGDRSPLAFEKTAKSTWKIQTGGAEQIVVTYDIYANSIGNRTRHVDGTHAFLSGSTVFLFDSELRKAPVYVDVQAPVGWKTASGLELAPDKEGLLFAANYDVLVDSPLEIGLHDRHLFEAAGLPHELIVWPQGLDYDHEQITDDITKIIETQTAIFRSAPYERYVFLVHAGAGGGGTEHLNSTIMQTSRAAIEGSRDESGSYKRFLGLVAHEFFHTWNVKSFRPAGIHPYDYLNENYTDLFWVAEGSTSYYTTLSQVRNGQKKEQSYIDGLARSIGSHRNNPGSRVQSLAASSFDAWTHFNKSSQDDGNTEISFYSAGSLASLALDMEVRARSKGAASYDDVLRILYERFPLDGPGYTTEDLIVVLDELSGSSFEPFFARYIESTETYPFETALLTVGLEFSFKPATKEKKVKEDKGEGDPEVESTTDEGSDEAIAPMKADLGLRLRSGGSGCFVSGVRSDGTAYSAGLVVGDEIVAVDGKRLRSGDLAARLKRREIGDLLVFTLLRHEHLLELEVEIGSIPDGKWQIKRVAEPTEEQKQAYASWTGHAWPGSKKEATESKEGAAASD